jgi:hypothetical protein
VTWDDEFQYLGRIRKKSLECLNERGKLSPLHLA